MPRSPRAGERTVVFSNGKYSGTWAADKMNGRGAFVFAAGGRWVGEPARAKGLWARYAVRRDASRCPGVRVHG